MAQPDTHELSEGELKAAPYGARLEILLTIVGFGWVLFTFLHVIKGRFLHAAIDLGIVTATAVIWLIVRRVDEKHHRWLAHVNLGVSIAGLGIVAMLSGQGDAMALWYMAAAPLLAVFQSGARSAMVWALIVTAVLFGIHQSTNYWWVEPEYISHGSELLFGQIFLVSLVLGFAIASFRTTQRYIKTIRRQEELMREKARALRQNATELEAARDEAVKASNVKSQFLANTSHDVRTPLNGVVGMTSVLLETRLSPEQVQMVQTISKSAHSLLAIINDILDFSKLEAGGVRTEVVAFDLRECIEDVLDLYSGPSFEKGIDLGYVVDEEVPVRVKGDVTRFRQIVLNLVNNGIKFTERGEVRVEVGLLDGQVHVRVKDTGIGIDARDHVKLFESFSQVDASTTRKYGGSGLGLAISKRLTELLGGRMWVESQLGEGATFHFTCNVEALDGQTPADISGWDMDWLDTYGDQLNLFGRPLLLVASPGISRDSLVSFALLWGMDVFVAREEERIRQTVRMEPNLALAILFAGDHDESYIRWIKEENPELPLVLVGSLAGPLETSNSDAYAGTLYRPLRYRQVAHTLESILGEPLPQMPRSLSPFGGELARRIPLRVLIAEDHSVNQKVALAMLRGLGYSPATVATGKEAVELASKEPFDLILMDMHMPELDGLGATKEIRALTGDSAWIIALTASVHEGQRRQCLEAGMNDFIAKPMEIETLVGALERLGKARGIMTSSDSLNAIDRLDAPLERLRDLFPGEPQKFIELIEEHLQNGADLVSQISQAVEELDWEGLRVAAHTLKGSAALFGSIKVAELSQRLESRAENKDATETSKLCESLIQSWTKSALVLEAEIDRNRLTVSTISRSAG